MPPGISPEVMAYEPLTNEKGERERSPFPSPEAVDQIAPSVIVVVAM